MKLPLPQDTVRIWTEEAVLPTYLVGEPNPNPMFLEKRVYQGSSGRVYPYPVIDRIYDEKVNEKHPVVYLENRFIKLMVMPAFGGRIQYAYDKTNNYPFIYHNRVIKPALVGLAGPWLSGGIEFNWPQHHRPGTYCPVDYTIRNNADGSSTLWLSDIEPMWHLKGTLGLTLYPEKAFLEISIRLFNPTPLPQSFHLWTNPAVHVNDHWQSIFPADVQAVYDHGKRDVSAFPIARGTYYKVDYSKGVDISWYKNLPVPTSYMAAHSDYDFIGGYDHSRRAGVLHVADHHAVPGKKQWVWGCGEFGKAWDRNLTDEDGPYAELMCGVFADNQPDFSWLAPFEEKQARQYFLPYKDIGRVRNATIEGALSLEVTEGAARFGAYTTRVRKNAVIRLASRERVLFESTVNVCPANAFSGECPLPHKLQPEQLTLSLLDDTGKVLVSYRPEPKQPEAIPAPARAIDEPSKVATNDALFLAATHLEQFRHAAWEPEDYYREALRRDPHDLRCNSGLGVLLTRRGQFAKAEPFLRNAVSTATRHNPNPREGEAHYYLGVCLRYQDKLEAAWDAFQKAAWSAALRDAAMLQLSQLASIRGNLEQALEFIQQSLSRNRRNQKARHLEIILQRKLGRIEQAELSVAAALADDPLDFGAANEAVLLEKNGAVRKKSAANLLSLMREDLHTHLEIAADYAAAGCHVEAVGLLRRVQDCEPQARAPGHKGAVGVPNSRPMLFYFLASYASQSGDAAAGQRYLEGARRQSPALCFPNSLDALRVLQAALEFDQSDGHAAYYLGNLWYDKGQAAEAIRAWELCAQLLPDFPTAHRNLALACFNKLGDSARALAEIEKAFTLEPADARVLFELDLLRKRCGVRPEGQFAFLQQHFKIVNQREDVLLEYITLLNFLERSEEAINLILNRKFHPWEGGEGKVTGQYVASLVAIASNLLAAESKTLPPSTRELLNSIRDNHKPPGSHTSLTRVPGDESLGSAAVELLELARIYPENIGEGKLHGARENCICYWLGAAYEAAGSRKKAVACWEEAVGGMKTPSPALYYNDQNPEIIFYQGIALRKLGRPQEADERFRTLLEFGNSHLKDKVALDFFAVSFPEFLAFDDDLRLRNQINCRYLSGLGSFGLGDFPEASRQFKRVLKLDPAHSPAKLHLRLLRRDIFGLKSHAASRLQAPSPNSPPSIPGDEVDELKGVNPAVPTTGGAFLK